MPSLSLVLDHPLGVVAVVFVIALLGWGGHGFFINFRKDKREAASDETDLLATVREIAQREVQAIAERAANDRAYYDEQLATARREARTARSQAEAIRQEAERTRMEQNAKIERLERREHQLTAVLLSIGVAVPPYETEGSTT